MNSALVPLPPLNSPRSTPTSEGETLQSGVVIRSEGGFYTVQTAGEQRLCTLVKRLRRGERDSTNPLAVGDHVAIAVGGAGQGSIEAIQPRRNELARTAPGRDALKHVLVSNLDLLLIVCALHTPEPNLAGLDRFLIIAEQSGIPTAIVVNKIDLGGHVAEAAELFAPYVGAGYAVVYTSALGSAGLEDLRALLRGKVSAIIGSSGVGKSTLLNAVQPGLRLRAGAVNLRTGKGRHTTTVAELVPLDEGGYVADTPGLRGIEPYDLDADDVQDYFPEMRPYLGACRFAGCTHLHEPGCAVRDALAGGVIAPSRYASYAKLYEEARRNQRPAWQK